MWNYAWLRKASDVVASFAKPALFVAISSAKLSIAGAALLSVDATVRMLYQLMTQESGDDLNHSVEIINLGLQVTAATLSVSVVVLSRFPTIWERLNFLKLTEQYQKTETAIEQCSPAKKAVLVGVGVFGFFTCISTGLGAYLGTRVVFNERLGVSDDISDGVAYTAGFFVVGSALCFKLPNIIYYAAKYLAAPSFSMSRRNMGGFIAVSMMALTTRFFIKELMIRWEANLLEQIVMQSLFTLSDFISNIFTVGSAFEENWVRKAKEKLKISRTFSGLMGADFLSSLLGLYWISIEIAIEDLYFRETIDTHNYKHDYTQEENNIRWGFFSLALLLAVPTALYYFNYILGYAHDNFMSVREKGGEWRKNRTFCLFSKGNSDERTLLPVKSNSKLAPK